MTDMNQVQVQLPQEQVSVTIYGAIGNTLQGPLFMIGKCVDGLYRSFFAGDSTN